MNQSVVSGRVCDFVIKESDTLKDVLFYSRGMGHFIVSVVICVDLMTLSGLVSVFVVIFVYLFTHVVM